MSTPLKWLTLLLEEKVMSGGILPRPVKIEWNTLAYLRKKLAIHVIPLVITFMFCYQ